MSLLDELTPEEIQAWKDDGVDVLTKEGLQEALDWYNGIVDDAETTS